MMTEPETETCIYCQKRPVTIPGKTLRCGGDLCTAAAKALRRVLRAFPRSPRQAKQKVKYEAALQAARMG